MTRPIIPFAALVLALAACSRDDGERTPERNAGTEQTDAQVPGDTDDSRSFAEIGPDEAVDFTGTEPFWGGKVTGTSLTYSTPENIDGTTITVERFAGRGGISFTGTYEGAPFDMMVTPGQCSDGMSDRTYPYTVTLQVQGEQRRGCAWTEDKPRTAPPGYEP